MLFLYFFTIINFAFGLHLNNPSVTIHAKQSFETSKSDFALELKKNNDVAVLNDEKFTSLVDLVSESLDLNGAKVKSIRWKCEITRSLGSLKVLNVIANIYESNIIFDINGATITVDIPIQHSCSLQCARTGNRKFGFVGRRSRECHNHCVERGLTHEETNQVLNVLLEKVPSVMDKINE